MLRLPLTGVRVLVVEDEYLLANDLKHILIDAGAATVRLSGEVSDALREVGTDGYSFALVDISLRGDPAYPVADMLMRSGLPFGFVTGYARNTLPRRFAQVPCWEKPIDPSMIVRDIARFLHDGRNPGHA